MKISCLQENLAQGLAIVGRAVATRSTLPVLSNILLATDMGRLKLAATDLEMGISCWVGAKIEEEGNITVPSRVLIDLVNALPPERVDMDLVTRTSTLHLQCARFEANIKGIDAQEFPIIPTFQEQENGGLELEADVLGQMIEQVAFAAATDESRPVLTGVLMHFICPSQEDHLPGKLTMAAADGFRLSVRQEERTGNFVGLSPGGSAEGIGERDIIVPARALTELARITGGNEEPISLTITSERNQILFHQENVDLVSQLIEGRFPDYTQIVPDTFTLRTVVETEALLKAVRMANIFARDAANIVRLSIGGDHVSIAATSAELGDHVGEIDAQVELAPGEESGEPLVIAFNANYLIDILPRLGTQKVVLETTTSSSPALFRPVGGADLTHVIMPIHISSA
ncbi:MAG: DNA polymerase III subunit beta [Chloroflexota bacterium]|nr:DNA polymerase III subunit beta [Chloroflexota bacterium]